VKKKLTLSLTPPRLDRMRIGVDRGNARGNKTLFFSAFAPPIARHVRETRSELAPASLQRGAE
jgi:hypothetical protein